MGGGSAKGFPCETGGLPDACTIADLHSRTEASGATTHGLMNYTSEKVEYTRSSEVEADPDAAAKPFDL